MRARSRFRAVVERLLPWYDPAEAAAGEARSNALVHSSQVERRQSAATRRRAARVRTAYLEGAARLGRR